MSDESDRAIAQAAARLGRPGLEPLVDELARRFGDSAQTLVRLGLRGLTTDQRAALADLFGDPRLPKDDAAVPVERLRAVLGLADIAALRRCVEQLRGPLGDRAADRSALREARSELWAWFERRCEEIDIAGLGGLTDWPRAVRRDGIRGSVNEHRRTLEGALNVIDALPCDGVPLAVFATRMLNDPHGLDSGRRVARLVVAAIADAARQPPPVGAEHTRETWELVGVEPDPLSSTVLVVGLRSAAAHPLAEYLDLHADGVEPVSLTLAQLRRWPLPPVRPDVPVFVVENPSLLAAATRRRWSGPPLVCSSGRPSMAVVRLLRQLGAAGAPLLQHADFDAAGLGICSWLSQRAGTTPWHMTADHYRSAVARPGDRLRVADPVPDTPWDPQLADDVRRTGLAVHEEEDSERLFDAMAAR